MVVRSLLIWLGLLYISLAGKAQLTDFHGDARAKGMARARVMLASQWSALDNPAGLAQLSDPVFGIYYENLFGVTELGQAAFSCGIPTKSGNFGIGFTTFGYYAFRHSQTAVSYGKSFGNKLSAGLSLHYLSMVQPAGFDNLYAFIPSLGLQLFPLKSLMIGVHVFNPASQSYIPSGYLDIPAGFTFGIGCLLGSEVLLCAETEKLAGDPFRYYGGTEIILYETFLFRFGISYMSRPEFSFGLGFKNVHWQVDIATLYHPVLGLSSSAGISYAIK